MEDLPDLVAAARDGEPRAFGRLVARFERMVFGLAYARTGDFHLAQDVTQETFIEAYRTLGALRHPAAFPAWLRVITLRQAARLAGARHLPAEPLDAAVEVPAPGPDPEQAALEGAFAAEVRTALRKLPEGQRLVFTLSCLHDRSQAEIARFLGLPLTTVKKRLHDARRRLQSRLQGSDPERRLSMADEAVGRLAPKAEGRIEEVVALVRAVETGDAAAVRRLLAKQPALHRTRFRHQDPRGETLLHVAVAGDGKPETDAYLAVLQALLEAGAEVNARGYPDNNEGATPLIYAAWANKPLTVERLLSRGADPELQDDRGRRAIDRAARPDRQEIFERLIQAGARYTLHHTVRAGLTGRARELLDRNPALLNQPDPEGSTPLHAAVSCPEMLVLLLERGADLEGRDARGRTPLHCALENADANAVPTITERKPAVDLLLRRGARVDLFAAAALGDGERARALLEEDPSHADAGQADGMTPLFYAARFGSGDIVAALLERGARMNLFVDRWWMDSTPLCAAVRAGHLAVVQRLLVHGADPDLQNHHGYTPLACAARWRHDAAARLLLERGARPDLRDHSGLSALDWAAWTGSETMAQALIERGADVDARGPEGAWSGRTPLHYAAEHGHTGVVKLLLAVGADRKAKDRNGKTPLAAAQAAGRTEVATLLRQPSRNR